MSVKNKDFFGKEVTDAIKSACQGLGVSQEKLDIEVVETGSTGIFGLIRKKAHIRVQLKPETVEEEDPFEIEAILESSNSRDGKKHTESTAASAPAADPQPEKNGDDDPVTEVAPKAIAKAAPEVSPKVVVEEKRARSTAGEKVAREAEVEASPESIELVQSELLQIVELMGFPSTVDVETEGLSVTCTLRGEHEEHLVGAEGKVADSLQYLLRKIVSRKVPERLRIAVNVGDFRERRLEDLKVKAVEFAAKVKEDGKTQILPALNPSERRAIHMILQEDKEIRSRSVGDGLFKKILIYKPGKGNRGGRKRSSSRGRRDKAGQKDKSSQDS